MVLMYGDIPRMINFDSLREIGVVQNFDSPLYGISATTNGSDVPCVLLLENVTKEVADAAFKKIKTCLIHGDAICDLQEFIG